MSDVVELPDGRRLGYEPFGDPDGVPVVYCHGTPGSRLGGRLLSGTAAERGVRLLAVDRPGMGLSTHDPERRIVDVAGDVAALADAAGADRFGVVGHSGGGPSALAIAARLPDRVTGVAIASGVPHPSVRGRSGFGEAAAGLFAATPWLGRPPLSVVRWLAHDHPERLVALIRRTATPPDRDLLADADVRGTLAAAVREAFREGTRGPAVDAALLGDADGWGFEPADVSVPVSLHHGSRDRTVAIEGVRRMGATLPGGTLRVDPGEGHLSTLVRNAGAVLAAAVGESDRDGRGTGGPGGGSGPEAGGDGPDARVGDAEAG